VERRRLIDRKQQVIAEAARLRRDLRLLRERADDRAVRRLIRRLEHRLDSLAGEEQRLRGQIDRAPRD
jgi:hypothetical protein